MSEYIQEKGNMTSSQSVGKIFRDYLPPCIQLDISTRCNLDCITCSLHKYQRQKSMMSMETFACIEPVIKKFKTVLLGCNGEPFLHKDLFVMARRVRKRLPAGGIIVVTNGTLFTARNIKQLVSGAISEVIISVDGSRSGTFEKIRKGARFKHVISNIKKINACKEKYKSRSPILAIRFTANTLNINELPELIKMAAKWKIAKVSVYNLEPYFSGLKNKTLYCKKSKLKTYMNIFFEAALLAKKSNIILILPPLIPRKTVNCVLSTVHISPDGDLCLCPGTSYERPFYYSDKKMMHKQVVLGNVRNESIETIWNKKRFKKLRRDLCYGKFPSSCKSCLSRSLLC